MNDNEERQVAQRLLDTWRTHHMDWHMNHARPRGSTPLSYCVGVSEALTLMLNEHGIAAETVTYETTICLSHPDQEIGRRLELSPRNRAKLGDHAGLDGHAGVETEWGFYDPTFDQFGVQGPWRAPLNPIVTAWDTVAVPEDMPEGWADERVLHAWDFAVGSTHGQVTASAYYREMKRYSVVTQSLVFFLADKLVLV